MKAMIVVPANEEKKTEQYQRMKQNQTETGNVSQIPIYSFQNYSSKHV